jgi:hypothetical protein
MLGADSPTLDKKVLQKLFSEFAEQTTCNFDVFNAVKFASLVISNVAIFLTCVMLIIL